MVRRRLGHRSCVGCAEAQSAAAEQPHGDNSVGHLIGLDYSSASVSLDVVYHYDEYPDWAASIVPAGADAITQGRATGVSDRAQRAVLAYDRRGNVTWTARQLALISPESASTRKRWSTVDRNRTSSRSPRRPSSTTRPTPTSGRRPSITPAGRCRWSCRPTRTSTPSTTAPVVGGALTYTRRGLPFSASVSIDSSTQTIVSEIEYERDGLVRSLTYGDPTLQPDGTSPRAATVSTTTYDIRRRPTRMTTTRGPTSSGVSGSELGAVTTVVDQQLVWDAVNNLTATIDHRDAAEWPAGHRPQTTLIGHDSLYRVIAADFAYTQLDGSRTDYDAGSDWRTEYGETYASDPMRQEPAPMVADTTSANRVVSLTWSWDYLANQTSWTDDATPSTSARSATSQRQRRDRAAAGAIYLATDIDLGTGPGGGWVEVDYGDGGNVLAMTVHGQCTDVSAGGCWTIRHRDDSPLADALRDTCTCANEQHYVYRWDELNRLAEARRYDRGGDGRLGLAVRQRYRYDGANQRTVKQTLDEDECGATGSIRATDRAVRRTRATSSGGGSCGRVRRVRGDDVLGTETQYVVGGARMVWKHAGVVRGSGTTGAAGRWCRSGI